MRTVESGGADPAGRGWPGQCRVEGGTELLRQARHEYPDLDVIRVTAARDLETVRNAMQGGAIAYGQTPSIAILRSIAA